MKTTRALLGLSLCLASAGISRAQTGILSVSQARFASGKGNLAFLAAGVAAPLLYGKSHRPEVAGRFDKVLSVALATQALKAAFKERRPDGSSRDSFPSGHSSAAFAVALVNAQARPKDAPFWYAGAALIGDSRVTLKRHYVHDVVAGAALGLLVPRLNLVRRL